MVGGGGILQDWLAERNLIPFISCNATRQQYFISNVCCLCIQGMRGRTTATRKFFWILCTTLKPPQRKTSKAYNPREMVPLGALDSSYWNINRQWAIQCNGSGMHCGTWREKQTSTQRSLAISKFCLNKGVSWKKSHPPHPPKNGRRGVQKKEWHNQVYNDSVNVVSHGPKGYSITHQKWERKLRLH